jgi:hypothetical protein
MGEKQNALNALVGNDKDKSVLERPRRRCEDRIKINLKKIEEGIVNWTHLAQDVVQGRAVLSTEMNNTVFMDVMPRILPEFTLSHL